MENELKHHGVLGMKWGIRRTPAQLGHKPKTKRSSNTKNKKVDKKKPDSSIKKTTKPKPKSVKDMSDEELMKVINRIQLEQRYNALNPKHVSKGKKFVDRVVNRMVVPAFEDAGRQIIKNYLTSTANKKLNLNIDSNKNNKK